MPSFTIHGLIPLLFLLAVRRLDARKVWILWPLTFAPDLDYLFPGLHRAAFGNVLILLPALAGLAWSLWPGRADPERAEWFGIAAAYLASHLVMDVFTGGSVLLYPFSTYNFCYLVGIDVVTATNTLQPYFEVCSREGIPRVAEVYPWLSPLEGAMLAFVLPAALVASGWNAWRYARERRAWTPEARAPEE